MDFWIYQTFLTQASVIFIQENAAFMQVLDYQDWHNQLLNTFIILRKPLAFMIKTLKKYVKHSLKYRTSMKTHFNCVFIQIFSELSPMSVRL